MGQYNKGLKYLKSVQKFIKSNIEKAILYNNMARMYLSLNEIKSSLNSNKLCFENIVMEAAIVLKERLIKPNYTLITENKYKIELISFLFYNNGFLLEKIKLEDESYYIYKKGYEFSLSTLGELNILTDKFRPKILNYKNIPKSLQNFNDMRVKSFDSKYDSDIDYNFVLDREMVDYNNIMSKLKFANNNSKINIKSTKVIKYFINFFRVIKKEKIPLIAF